MAALWMAPNLDDALDQIQVMHKASADPNCVGWWPEGLPWAVTTPNEGVVALFTTEAAACHYRLMMVAQTCNPAWANHE